MKGIDRNIDFKVKFKLIQRNMLRIPNPIINTHKNDIHLMINLSRFLKNRKVFEI